jgi:hypothetical protein
MAWDDPRETRAKGGYRHRQRELQELSILSNLFTNQMIIKDKNAYIAFSWALWLHPPKKTTVDQN